MQDETRLLEALRDALAKLDAAERERSRAWAWSASGLLDASERRGAQMEAEREIEEARAKLQKLRVALTALPSEERAWGSH